MKQDTIPPKVPAVTPELLERARAKDRDALADLYEATSLEIYRTIHALIRDEDLTLDVQQDAYLQAFSHLDQLRKPESFLPWLRQIAVNEARTQLRKKRPLLFSEMEPEPEGAEPELPDVRPEASPELSLDRKETSRMVQEILSDLSDGQRMLVGMYYYEQIPVAKIAEDTGLSVGTVKTQLYRGRKKVEAAVKRLEEKGVKLYGLSPLPFLLALLKRQEPAAEAGKTVLTGALTRAGVAPAAEAAAIHVGRSFFETVLGKVLLGVLAAGVIGGGAAGYKWYQNHARPGDVRPPETLEINLQYETDEDLTTEPAGETEAPTETETPTETGTLPDSDEDLTPVTSEPATESTEPVTEPSAEPATEPSTEPTQPSTAPVTEPTRPVGADDHIGPDPTEPSTEPTEPSTEPTEPSTDPTEPGSELIRVFWTNADSDEDLNYQWSEPNSKSYLCLIVRGDEIPSLSADQDQMLTLQSWGGNKDPMTTTEGYKVYYWTVFVNSAGTGHIYCRLNGSTQLIETVTIEAHAPEVIEYIWYQGKESIRNPESIDINVSEGVFANLEVRFCGVDLKDLNSGTLSDSMSVIPLHLEGKTTNQDGTVSANWSMMFSGEGTTTLSCTVNGTVLFSIRVNLLP